MKLRNPRLLAWRETDSTPRTPDQRLVDAILLRAILDALAGDTWAADWMRDPGAVELALWAGGAKWPPDLERARIVMLSKWTQGKHKKISHEVMDL